MAVNRDTDVSGLFSQFGICVSCLTYDINALGFVGVQFDSSSTIKHGLYYFD